MFVRVFRQFVNPRFHPGSWALWVVAVGIVGMTGCGIAKPGVDETGSVHAWADWPMPNLPGGGLPNPQKYQVSTAGGGEVVADQVTGLIWQRQVEDRRFTWSEALGYCSALMLAGRDDWRLPSRIELVSLLNLSFTRPTISPQAFPGTQPEWFWTASPQADDPAKAWFVYFYFGYPDTDAKSSTYPARCVRSGAPGSGSLNATRYAVEAETVRDLKTRLEWQRQLAGDGDGGGKLSWADAASYCAGRRVGGHDDWRLPSLQEFETIVDEGRSNPAIDPVLFPATAAEGFWSGTPWSGTPMLAWHVDFDRGSAAYDTATMPYRGRCVRWAP